MPPRRSVRGKRPSSQALEALAGASSPPARRRRAAGQSPSSNVDAALLAANPLVSAEVGNACPDPVLPTGFLDQVVARVTTEVTRQLQSLLLGACAPQSDVTLPTESALPHDSATANQAPTAVQSTLSAAVSRTQTEVPVVGNPVQRVVNSVQSALSGEQGLFPSLPCHGHKTHSLPLTYQWMLELPWSSKQRSGNKNIFTLGPC